MGRPSIGSSTSLAASQKVGANFILVSSIANACRAQSTWLLSWTLWNRGVSRSKPGTPRAPTVSKTPRKVTSAAWQWSCLNSSTLSPKAPSGILVRLVEVDSPGSRSSTSATLVSSPTVASIPATERAV